MRSATSSKTGGLRMSTSKRTVAVGDSARNMSNLTVERGDLASLESRGRQVEHLPALLLSRLILEDLRVKGAARFSKEVIP